MRQLILLLVLCSVAGLAQTPATGQFLLRLEPTRPGFTLQNMTAEEASLATQHVQYLKSLLDAGKLSLAAQVFEPKGLQGIVIVNASNRDAALALLNGDPGVKGNMFRGDAFPVRIVLEKPAPKTSAAVSADLEGDWEGAIGVMDRSLRVIVHFRNQPDKTVKATLDSPDQKIGDLPLTEVAQKDSRVEFQLRQVNGSYRGVLNKEGNQLVGEWTQSGNSAPLTLKKAVAK
jgi:uncharacterized protein YciI